MATQPAPDPKVSTINVATPPSEPASLTETTTEIPHKRDTLPSIHFPPESADATNPPLGHKLYSKLNAQCEGMLFGDFRIVSLIGRGGMGAVYRARQISLDREVALKVLAPDLASDPMMLARFKREAKVLGKLHHTSIISCHAVGEVEGVHYLALEYVDGKSLKQILKTHGRLSVEDAVSVALDLAHALKYAHEKHVIHRDVKPDNVLISSDGVVKLADLGLAKPEDEDMSLTASGMSVGTPIYMPPEQMRCSRRADAKVDIYALGILLYVILSKQRPFMARDFPELLREKEAGTFLPLRKKFKEIPERLELIIAKMIDRKPENRYQAADEVITALEQLNLASPFLSTDFLATQHVASRSSESTSPFTSDKHPVVNEALEETRAPRDNIWYVRRIMSDSGYGRVKELTFDQLKDQIESRHIDSRSLASRSPDKDFRTLSTFPEFDHLFRVLIVKVRAERRASKLKDEYEKIVHDVEEYERHKWWTRLFLSFGGWVKVVLIALALAGLGVLAYHFVPPVISFIAKRMGIM